MTNNEQALNDGDFYLSRCRVNRHVITITGGVSETVRLNGKVSKVVIDATQSAYLPPASGNIGRFQMFMDVEDGDGTELHYFDQITGLNYSGTGSNEVIYLEVSQGANQGTSSGHNGMHFSVSAPSTGVSGGGTFNEPASWNGLVCGQVRVTCDVAAPSALNPASTIRVIIYLE
jgi:hypothetical protein